MGSTICDLGVAARAIKNDKILLVKEALGRYQGRWSLPKGHVDSGEDPETAVLRELYEETGIDSIEMGPVIWTQHVQFTFGGYFFDSYEKIHVAWCEGGEYQPKHLEALEAAAFLGAKWWDVGDLLESDEPVLPTLLREHITPIVSGDLPSEPIDISPIKLEES